MDLQKRQEKLDEFNRKSLADKYRLDIANKIFAVLLSIVYAVYVLNGIFGFIPPNSIGQEILTAVMFYCPMSLVILVNFEFFADKHIALRIMSALFWVIVMLLSAFPIFNIKL